MLDAVRIRLQLVPASQLFVGDLVRLQYRYCTVRVRLEMLYGSEYLATMFLLIVELADENLYVLMTDANRSVPSAVKSYSIQTSLTLTFLLHRRNEME